MATAAWVNPMKGLSAVAPPGTTQITTVPHKRDERSVRLFYSVRSVEPTRVSSDTIRDVSAIPNASFIGRNTFSTPHPKVCRPPDYLALVRVTEHRRRLAMKSQEASTILYSASARSLNDLMLLRVGYRPC